AGELLQERRVEDAQAELNVLARGVRTPVRAQGHLLLRSPQPGLAEVPDHARPEPVIVVALVRIAPPPEAVEGGGEDRPLAVAWQARETRAPPLARSGPLEKDDRLRLGAVDGMMPIEFREGPPQSLIPVRVQEQDRVDAARRGAFGLEGLLVDPVVVGVEIL